jgi:nicotinate-nucleotide adenylyltransferase
VKRIAIYGGTFDPVHAGHLAVARGVLRWFALDEVWLMPAFVAPHKRHATPPTSAWHRYAMLALASQDDAKLRVSALELDAPAKPYTIETLTRLSEELRGKAILFFVMGLDSWLDIKTWREWEKVLQAANHIVVARPGYEWTDSHVPADVRERVVNLRGQSPETIAGAVIDDATPRIYATDAVLQDVSATEIRQAVAAENNAEWLPLVPPAVAAYIEKYRLYSNL